MKLNKGFLSVYSSGFSRSIVYMLQSSEYQIKPYLNWLWQNKDFSNVEHRKTLKLTFVSKLLLIFMYIAIYTQILIGLVYLFAGIKDTHLKLAVIGIITLISYPLIWAHLVIIPLILGKHLFVNPKNKKLINNSQNVFSQHKATKIAVAGSYGKTTVKELLLTILSEGKKVAATPANKNVAVSHAAFAAKLSGDEEIIVIEYGEGQPGDVAKFAETTKPDIGIITGLAPAHLDKYKTLSAAAEDIFSLADYLGQKNVYVNEESQPLKKYLKPEHLKYSSQGIDGWKISGVLVGIENLQFTMAKGKHKLKLTSNLIGRHLVGPIALCVALASELGLTDKQIIDGVAKSEPFEHRMQPRMLAGGWIIDDTYNGNLEGARAGLNLLAELDAKRKIYVTPGLVDQGDEAESVHKELGQLIAKANPNQVVLMQNSVTNWIKSGLENGKYDGEVKVEDDPLNYYTNLEHVIAAGDVIMMQNDWTDNYK